MSRSGNLYFIAIFIGPFMSAEVIGGISLPFQPASRNASIAPGTCKPWGANTALMLCPYFAIMACMTCLPFTGLQSE